MAAAAAPLTSSSALSRPPQLRSIVSNDSFARAAGILSPLTTPPPSLSASFHRGLAAAVAAATSTVAHHARSWSVAAPPAAPLSRLPDDLLHEIFALVIEFENSPAPLATLSLVCKRWRSLCVHSYICELVAKRFVVAYPLLKLQGDMPDALESPCAATAGGASSSSSPSSSQPNGGGFFAAKRGSTSDLSLLPGSSMASWSLRQRARPTPQSLRAAVEQLHRHSHDVQYKRLVTRRRGYVLHSFISLALFFFASFIGITMCTLEGLDPITLNNPAMAFACLWAAYVAILGAVLSNVIMKAHFEPQPLIPRIQRNQQLIALTTGVVVVCVFAVALPTWMVQRNVLAAPAGELVFDWRTCAAPITFALMLWQVEALYSVRDAIAAWVRAPDLASLYTGSAHLAPTLFALAIAATFEFVRTLYWPYLLLCALPLFITFFILAIVFLMDFSASHRESEGVAALCLLFAAALPVCLVAFPIRGYSLLPGVVSAWGFFFGHLLEAKKTMEQAALDEDDDDDNED